MTMITEQQLRDTLRSELARHGDGSNVQLSNVIAGGRRRQRATAVRRTACALAALVVTGGGFALASVPAAADSWQLAPAPEQVNQRIVEIVEARLPAGISVNDVDLKAYADPAPGQGSPEPGGLPLPRSQWSEADAWLAKLTLDTGAEVQVFLGHAEGETEGDAAATCATDVAAGVYSVCDAGSVSRQGENVAVIWREGFAELAGDGTLYGPGTLVAPDGTAAPSSTPVSTHGLESHPGGDFLISVQELDPQGSSPSLDREAMADIALSAELLEAQ
ncbi:hypothetical protein GCM10009795_005530 [Nocardioides hankookensis]|uniref:Anti-sigma factor n=1 Tax=Nocardioides hankookensis TaxID=443157 RepID=A0ABW1LGE4_9ACTN